jgi:hypothetical protein
VNAAAILISSGIGLAAGSRLPERFQRTVTTSLGLATLLIGVQMALEADSVLVVIAGLVVGGVMGEWLDIAGALERIGDRLKVWARSGAATLATGYVTASLVFCVGPMTVVRAIQEGTGGPADLLCAKSLRDGAASVAFASGLGVGVRCAAVTVIAVQGALTLLGARLAFLLRPDVLRELTATGGLVIVAIGFLLLDIKRLRVANLLPALVVAVLLATARRSLGR